MAGNVVKNPLIRISSRGFSARAATNPAECLPGSEIQYTQLPNKVLVSSQDLGGPLSRVSIVFRTGPRNETHKNLGVTHVIRSLAGFSTQHFTPFGILRNVTQCGANLSCSGDRETTSFDLVASRDNIECVLKYLASVASAPAFKPWQVSDNRPRIKYELSTLTSQARTLDILHKAAFRTGLGNSLYVKKDHVDDIDPEILRDFYQRGFTSNRASVVGYNVDHADLTDYVRQIEFPSGDPPAGNNIYYGGEIRKDKNSYFAHVAIATQGAGLKDLKEALTYGVLQHAYGTSPSVKWGKSPSPLSKAVSAVTEDVSVVSLNLNYTDTGLFGFFLSGSGLAAGKAVEAAFKVIKSGNVSEADVKRGKQQLKAKILREYENSGTMVEDVAGQVLSSAETPVFVPGPVLAEAVDKIAVSDVVNAAKKVSNGKFSLAGFGNLSEVPFLDQLK